MIRISGIVICTVAVALASSCSAFAPSLGMSTTLLLHKDCFIANH